MKKTEEKKDGNAILRLASTLGGMLVACTAIVAIFAREEMWILGWIAVSLALLGIFLGRQLARS